MRRCATIPRCPLDAPFVVASDETPRMQCSSTHTPLTKLYTECMGHAPASAPPSARPLPKVPFGVEPKITRLPNGKLVISTGRPGLVVWVADDPPTKWTPFNVTQHHNAAYPNATLHYKWPIETTAYTGMVAVPGKNEVIVSYDLNNHYGAIFTVRIQVQESSRTAAWKSDEAVELFVSPDGADTATGSRKDPWRTLDHARSCARLRLQAGHSVTVSLLSGTYRVSSTLTFSSADSPAAGATYVWRAHPANTGPVRLSASQLIPWQNCSETTDARIPVAARSSVRVVNLTAMGVGDFGHAGTSGWEFKHPDRLEVFVDGEPQTLARYPNRDDKPTGSIFTGFAMMSAGISVNGSQVANAISWTAPYANGLDSDRVARVK